ncbi:jhy protein homolog isoform X1 [Anguilla rostrata]|uniref:jhy protein homolog isoform X1 n=1 Tax=Anguilla rostrata TaxID=7938 RepID=UPI0030CB32C0
MDNTMELNRQNVIQAGTSDIGSKEEPEKSSLMEDAQISLWNSLESDTESLAQERRYQMELKTRIRQANEMVNPTNGEGEELEESSGEEERDDENDLEEFAEENHYIYDSLDVVAPQQGQINTVPHDTEVGEILRGKRQDMLGYGPAGDEYAALRYDPNWRTTLKGDRPFEEGTQLLLEEEGSNVYASPGEGSPWKARDHSGNGEQKNRSARRQAPAVGFATDVVPDRCSESKSKPPPTPYYPSPQSVAVAGAETAVSERQSHHRTLHRPECAASNRRALADPAAVNRTHARENQAVFHEPEDSYEEMNERYAKEYQLFYERESAHTHETTSNNQDSVYNGLNWSRRLSNMRQTKPKKDIVERNKITLGVRTKQASYLCAHGPKGAKEDHKNKQEPEAVEEIIQHQYLDPELRWQLKTQMLKVHREKKKGKREGLPIAQAPGSDQSERVNPSVPQDGRAARMPGRLQQPGHAEVLVINEADPGGTPLSEALPNPQWRPDRPPYSLNTPTLNLNINLSASGDMAPFLGQEHKRTSLKLSSPHGPSLGTRPGLSYHVPMSGHYDPAQLAYYGPGYLPAVPQPALPGDWFPAQQFQGTAFLQQGSRRRPREVPPLWDQDSHSLPGTDSDRAWMAAAMFQPAGERNQYLSLGEQHVELRAQHRLPAQSPASYTVLPPIGEMVTSDSELSSQNTRQKINGMHRSSSEGYLAQLEKQKQLKEKTTYKAYTLKDYKALKQDVKLGGLGPNYEVTPITAEKIRQRQRYSDKVREHNKNISRIPFLPARNPGGGVAAENMVPRRKALEYARSIPKPKPPAEPKSGDSAGENDFLHERAQYLEHLDLSQLARLEMLQKRHEEEKQVVAHFKALRAV